MNKTTFKKPRKLKKKKLILLCYINKKICVCAFMLLKYQLKIMCEKDLYFVAVSSHTPTLGLIFFILNFIRSSIWNIYNHVCVLYSCVNLDACKLSVILPARCVIFKYQQCGRKLSSHRGREPALNDWKNTSNLAIMFNPHVRSNISVRLRLCFI